MVNKRKTTEEFKKEVYNKHGDGYTVLEGYKNAKTKILVRHNICGKEFKINPRYFLKDGKCECMRKSTRMSHEEFLEKVHLKKGDDYDVLEEYIDSKTKITFRHKVCGKEFKMAPAVFLNGQNCSICFGTPKKTTEEFKQEIYDKYGLDYTLLSEYNGKGEYVKIRHEICKTEYYVTPNNFLRDSRCPTCYGTPKKTTEEFKKQVYDRVGDEYSLIGEYVNASTRVTIKHNVCGDVYKIFPNSFLNGVRCSKCYGNKRLTTDEFKERVYKLVGDTYEVLGEYINTDTKIELMHKECGNPFKTTPHSFLGGSKCPVCNVTKGEQAVMDFLNDYSIKYKYNSSYGGCSYKGLLRFDFLILNTNNDVILIIEYDGIQHFQPVRAFGGEENFKENQIKDNIKNQFCKENDIPLLRIPYWEIDNICEILDEKLSKLRLI